MLGTSARSAPGAQGGALPRRQGRARSSATSASSAPTTSTCAVSTASAACRSTPTAGRSPTPPEGLQARGGPARAAVAGPRAAAGRAARARGAAEPGLNPGAAVALDPVSGEVLAMASHPTFDPTIFTKALTDARYKALVGEGKSGGPGPIFNRAISGAYPTASTFKPFSALAGLDKGLISAGMTIPDGGCIQVAERERCNAKEQAYGTVDLTRALQVSSDVYFYRLGMSAFFRGAGHPALGAALGFDKHDRHRPAGRVRRRDPRQELAQGDQRLRARLPQAQEASRRARTSSPPVRGAAGARTCATSTSATTRASRSARATCSPRRCRSPSPTRRWRTAATS